MSYRDDHAALRSYHDDLVRQLTTLEDRAAQLVEVERERDRLARELARIRHDLDHHRTRTGPIRLDNLRVASPCHERWDAMVGDDRVRDCGRCDKPVFNLSEMTAADAEELLAARGESACVRFFRRADGMIMTSDCAVGQRTRRTQLAVAAGLLATAAGVAIAVAAKQPEREPTMGVVGRTQVVLKSQPEVALPLQRDPDDGIAPDQTGYSEVKGKVSFTRDAPAPHAPYAAHPRRHP